MRVYKANPSLPNTSSLLRSKRDRLFMKPLYPKSGFVFDERVSEVFDDMIVRSIPYYEEVLLQCVQFVHERGKGGILYDLGSSTGNFILALAASEEKFPKSPKWHYMGFDNSSAMVERAQRKSLILLENIASTTRKGDKRKSHSATRVDFCCKDINTLQFVPHQDLGNITDDCKNHFYWLQSINSKSSRVSKLGAISMHYTLQFLPVKKRPELLARVYHSLKKGGVFILSEKVKEAKNLHRHFTKEYYRFKSKNEYSRSEIQLKRTALEKVLVPLSTEVYLNMLQRVGFREVAIAFKWNNFLTIFAVK